MVYIDVGRVVNERLFAFQVSGRMFLAPVLVSFFDQGIIKVEVAITSLVCIGGFFLFSSGNFGRRWS